MTRVLVGGDEPIAGRLFRDGKEVARFSGVRRLVTEREEEISIYHGTLTSDLKHYVGEAIVDRPDSMVIHYGTIYRMELDLGPPIDVMICTFANPDLITFESVGPPR